MAQSNINTEDIITYRIVSNKPILIKNNEICKKALEKIIDCLSKKINILEKSQDILKTSKYFSIDNSERIKEIIDAAKEEIYKLFIYEFLNFNMLKNSSNLEDYICILQGDVIHVYFIPKEIRDNINNDCGQNNLYL